MRPLDGIGRCASTTDAVFHAHSINDVPAKLLVSAPLWVPQDDDSLFVSVLRAMRLVKKDGAEGKRVCKLMLGRLETAAVKYGFLKANPNPDDPKRGDAPNLRWDPSSRPRAESNGPELDDVARLRLIVAAHVREHFVDYYKQHMHVAKGALRAPYEDDILGWSPNNAEEATALWREIAQRMVDLDSTSAHIKDGLGAALRYQKDGRGECAEECLVALGAFVDNPDNVRHEIRDALVLAIATPKTGAPTVVLNALADLLGVHIDLYQQSLPHKSDALPKKVEKAVCVESYGPAQDDALKQSLEESYKMAGLWHGLPLFELLQIQYLDSNETFYSYRDTSGASVQTAARTPIDMMDDDQLDPLLQFYEAVAKNSPLKELPPFVDPCAHSGAQDSPQSAFVSPAHPSDESAQLEEAEDEVNGDDGDDEDDEEDDEDDEDDEEDDDDGDDPSYMPSRRNVPSDDEEDEEDDDEDDDRGDEEVVSTGGNDGGGDGGGDDGPGEGVGAIVVARRPSSSAARPLVPIRPRTVEEADYYMKDVLMTVEQATWATERMDLAHEHFIEHMSSRMGYGEVMLMRPPRLDPATIAPRPTGGEIARSKKQTSDGWRVLMADERTRELSDRLKNTLIGTINAEIDFGNSHVQGWRAVAADKSRPASERDYAQASVHEFNGNQQLFHGYRQAMRLALGVNEFHNHEEGGWIALFAWWHRKNQAADARGEDSSMRAETDIAHGRQLCAKYSDIRSTARWVKDKAGRHWRGMWDFMYQVDVWLDEEAQAETREKVDALATDDAFAEATDWPALLPDS